jgi:carbon-monoxide dehydrogenase small subunit
MIQVSITVNGFARELLVYPHETLLHTLRERLGLTGTKKGCDLGSCGSCTVLLDGKPVLGCITPTVRCQGKTVLTIEGVAQNGRLHPVQQQLCDKGAIQCGYCTPGIVMTSIALLDRSARPDDEEIREALSGNLCRCTGYIKIIEAVRAASEEMTK